MFVRLERDEIRERLKRLNLVIVIKKYWQMVECIFRGFENWQGCLGGFQWGVHRNSTSGVEPFVQVGGVRDKDLGCGASLNSLCQRASKGRCLADI